MGETHKWPQISRKRERVRSRELVCVSICERKRERVCARVSEKERERDSRKNIFM